jgi:hypothetical protein
MGRGDFQPSAAKRALGEEACIPSINFQDAACSQLDRINGIK